MLEQINQTRSEYDRLATSYDVVRYQKKYMQRQDQRERAFVRQRVRPGGRVLEVGCGTGRITRLLTEISSSVTAVDVSKEMLKLTRAKLRDRDNLKLIQGDLFGLTKYLPFSSFDVVVCLRVLPHIANMSEALGVLAASAVPGGQVVFDMWNRNSLIGLARRLLRRRHRIPTFYQSYDQMLELTDSVGLIIQQETPLSVLPGLGGLANNVASRPVFSRYAYSVLFDARKALKSAQDVGQATTNEHARPLRTRS